MSKARKDTDVFLSWTGQDRALKDRLRVFLESNGLRCYDSDRDCRGDYCEDFGFREERSAVYLLILTPALLRSPYRRMGERYSVVKQELRYATYLEAIGEINFVILSAFDRAEEEQSEGDSAVFFRAHTAAFSKIPLRQGEEESLSFSACLKQVQGYVKARKERHPVPSCQPLLPVAHHKILLSIDRFIGREKELASIGESFKAGSGIVVLSGMGGIGKTELAKRFASDSDFLCPQVVSYKGEDEADFRAFLSSVSYSEATVRDFSRLASDNSEMRYQCLENALSSLGEETLLVLDNVNGLNRAFLQKLCEKMRCRILITTRREEDFGALSGVSVIRLKAMEEAECRRIFENIYGELSEHESELFADKVYGAFLGNTQAIVMIAKMLSGHGITLAEYAEREEEFLKENLYKQEIHGEEVFDTVANNLCRFFKINKFLQDADSSVSGKILAAMIFVEQVGIEERSLKKILSLSNSNEIISLAGMGLVNRYAEFGSRYFLTMHPMVVCALRLNGIEPSKELSFRLAQYYKEQFFDHSDPSREGEVEKARLFLGRALQFLPIEEKNPQEFENPAEQSGDLIKQILEEPSVKPYDVLDVLLDEDNRDPIVLQDNNGKKLVFEQVAIIPFDGIIYCVLKPQSKINGVKSDEAVVFYVLEEQGEPAQLRVCEDERIA